MAEFFNKKEEIIEVQLTEYGKYLLSLGKLKPSHYAFFDDEILYNSEYAPSGTNGSRLTEAQNDCDRRIRYETPNLKVIPTRTGAETRVARFINNVSSALGSNNSDPAENVEALHQQAFIEKVNFSSYPIGSADISKDYTAAWNISLLKNTIVSKEDYIITNPSSSYADLNNGVITLIPQLNIDVDYKTFFQEGEITPEAISATFEGTEIFLSLERNYLYLDILEGNTKFEKENFDIEVFYQSPASSSASGVERPSTLVPMAFRSEKDKEDLDSLPRPLGNPETNVGEVEYYFDVYLDQDIPGDLRADVGLPIDPSGRVPFVRDLYITDDEEPC